MAHRKDCQCGTLAVYSQDVPKPPSNDAYPLQAHIVLGPGQAGRSVAKRMLGMSCRCHPLRGDLADVMLRMCRMVHGIRPTAVTSSGCHGIQVTSVAKGGDTKQAKPKSNASSPDRLVDEVSFRRILPPLRRGAIRVFVCMVAHAWSLVVHDWKRRIPPGTGPMELV